MANFCGKWKLVDSDNFEEFMRELGVGMMMRKLGGSSKPLLTITDTDGEWSVKTETTFKTTEIKFKLGEEFEEDRLDGVKIKSTMVLEDGKLIQKQYGDGKDVIIVREIDGDSLKVVCTVNNVTATRRYERA